MYILLSGFKKYNKSGNFTFFFNTDKNINKTELIIEDDDKNKANDPEFNDKY